MSEPDVTPPLDEFLREYEADDNVWWVTDCGHHMNLFDAAVERAEAPLEFAEWVVGLNTPGNEERRSVTLEAIIARAAVALVESKEASHG